MFQPHKTLKNKENWIDADEFSFWEIESFSFKKVVVEVEEGKEEMQNWSLFETGTNWGWEFESQLRKKLKNRENLIDADEFRFHKI